MAGISDKALKTQYAENKYRFNKGSELQNKEFSDGSGLELYDAVHRLYDPQIGRFGQIDKFADMSEDMSSYIFASDNPISRNDPYGLKDSVPTLQPVTVVGHKNNSIAPIIFIPQIDNGKQTLDHLSVANIIPTISIPSPNTLLGQLSILEKSKEVAEKGEKVADAAKAIARILKSLLAKGSLGAKDLSLLEDYAGDVGPIAALAQGALDLAQGLKGDITPQECENSLSKLGFVYGVGFLGDVLGGPVAGLVLSTAAETFLDKVDKLDKESYDLNIQNSTQAGYENVTIHP
jgi:RHS repeat-associated protein